MSWHYAEGKERRGPFSEQEIRAFVAQGVVTGTTLVWRPGMDHWQAASMTELFPGTTPAGAAEAQFRCIITGKDFPASQIIQTADGPVSHEAKELYYQSRREGAPLPVAENLSNARADGNYVVAPAAHPRLAPRCVKTNAPVTADEFKSKTLYWYPPLIALTILLNLIIFLVLYLVLRKKVVVEIPISAAGRKIVRNKALITWSVVLGGVAGIIASIINESLILLLPLAFVAIIGGLIYGARTAVYLRVAKLKNGEAWFAGASPEYLDSLPRYR